MRGWEDFIFSGAKAFPRTLLTPRKGVSAGRAVLMVDLLFSGLLQGLWLLRERGQGLEKGGAPVHPLDSCYTFRTIL